MLIPTPQKQEYSRPAKVFTMKKGIAYFDSRKVAEMIGKRHAHLLRDIENYIAVLENAKLVSLNFFIKSCYKIKGNNKTYPRYLISKMGCEFIGNKLTGEKGILFTALYVKLFNEMEIIQAQKQTPYWQQLREKSKEEHRLLSDSIKAFAEYAKVQGSRNSRFYYMNFNKMINKIVEIIDRDNADVEHLHSAITVMKMTRTAIIDGMAKNEPYKTIYSTCRERLTSLKDWGALALAV